MASAVAVAVCGVWVADVVALVDAAALIIAANASLIVSPVLIKRKYQNTHAHIQRDITFEYLYVIMLASMCALSSLRLNLFQSTDKCSLCSFLLCFIFVFLRLISLFFSNCDTFMLHGTVNICNSLPNIFFYIYYNFFILYYFLYYNIYYNFLINI